MFKDTIPTPNLRFGVKYSKKICLYSSIIIKPKDIIIKKKLLKYVNCFIKVLNNFQSEELNDIIDAAAEKLFDKTGQRFRRRAFSTARLSFLTVLTLQPILYFLKTFPPIITVLIFISLSTISKSAS